MPGEVLLVLAHLTDEHQAGALAALQPLIERLFPGARLRAVYVDNAADPNLERQLAPGIDQIGGDNRWREFSAWDRGLAFLESLGAIDPGTPVILANDTLHRSYGSGYLGGFTPAKLRSALRRGGLVGYVDAYPAPVQLFGLELRSWVRTSLWVAPWRTVARLRPLALGVSDDALFGDRWETPFRVPSPLSDNYRAYLGTWLWGGPARDGFAERWHSQRPLAAETFEGLKGKIRSILCEHHLSARAREAQVPLIDVRAPD